jgi:hypothetical protein
MHPLLGRPHTVSGRDFSIPFHSVYSAATEGVKLAALEILHTALSYTPTTALGSPMLWLVLNTFPSPRGSLGSCTLHMQP